ncbi:MAG: hypothetical protein M3R50_12515, partial [Bacteroidota bacterium]|nr:hypothetical protein [Bacteroidota bacterium]
IIILAVILFSFVTVKSQTILSPGFSGYPQSMAVFNNNHANDSLSTPKWFFSSYRSVSTSVSFFKGGNASVFSAPMGLQLNRRLNNNLYAFANVTVAPSYISINPSYLTGFNKNFSNSSSRQNSFGLYPAASLGLMYVNDAKTFSISGSISAERSSYPLLPYYPQNNRQISPIPGRQF